MDRLKLFVLVVLCYFKVSEVTTAETNTTADISKMTTVAITSEPSTRVDITTVDYEKTNGTETPETAIEINKNQKVTTEGSPVSKNITTEIPENATQVNLNTTEVSGKIIMTTIEDVNNVTTELPTDATKFSEVSFIIVSDETTTLPTTVGKRDARQEVDTNDITGKPRVIKESHWSEDDSIDRFAEEAQTVRITSKVKDQNLHKEQSELDFDHDPFQRLRFKTAAGTEGRSLKPSLSYISRVLSNHVYPTKNKENKYSINVQKTRFFDDSIIRPTHKVDRVKFYKGYRYDTEKEKEVRQVTTNPRKVYSIGELYKPQVLSLIEALPGNTRNNMPYAPISILPNGYANFQIPMSPERKIMKKFFRKIFETKSRSEANPKNDALVYVGLDSNNKGSKTYNKETKESLEGVSNLNENDNTVMDDELFQKEKCELLKHVYITRSIDKKIANLERLFLKLFGVIMNGGNRFSKETINLPKPAHDKQYYYVATGNNPQKRSLQLFAEKPYKSLKFLKVDCDKLGNCGLKRFRKSVTNESSMIDKEIHTTYENNDVPKMLDALFNATNEAMDKFNVSKYYEDSNLMKDNKFKPGHVVDREIRENETKTNEKDKKTQDPDVIKPEPVKKPVWQVQKVQQFGIVPQVHQVTQKDFYPSQIGNYNNSYKSKNKTDQYRFKKHRFIPSLKTEETLRKLKMLIHKYHLSENTFVRRLYESMKKTQKLNSTDTTLGTGQDNQIGKTYVPQRRVYRNKYEMAKHSKQIMERLRMARNFAQTVQQQTKREKRQLKELTENQNHTLMLMDFLMDQDFPLEVTHEDDYVDFMTELVANAHYLKQPRKKTTTSKPKRKAPMYSQMSSEEMSPQTQTQTPTKKTFKRNIYYEDPKLNLAKDKLNEKEYHPAYYYKTDVDNH